MAQRGWGAPSAFPEEDTGLLMNVSVSAVVCTRNRPNCLGKAIGSLVDQTLPKGRYEIIVVDNASTDNTKAVVEGFQSENLRYIYEPVLGLSRARNTGWQNARGEYVAFIDDDAMACPEWLERIVTAFETVKPRPGSVGGKVVPIWGAARPAWLPKDMEPALTIVDWSDEPILLTQGHQFLAGANVAYPRAILETVKGFSVNLGRKGTSLLSSEEYLIERYIRRSGLGVYYDPRILVEHHIHAQRLTVRWLCRRYFWQGASFQVINLLEGSGGRSRRYYLAQAIRNLMGFVASRADLFSVLSPADSEPRVRRKCTAYGRLGAIWYQFQIGIGKVKKEY